MHCTYVFFYSLRVTPHAKFSSDLSRLQRIICASSVFLCLLRSVFVMRIRAADEFCVDIFPSVDGRPIIGHSAPFPPPGQRTAHVRQASVRPRPAPPSRHPDRQNLKRAGRVGEEERGAETVGVETVSVQNSAHLCEKFSHACLAPPTFPQSSFASVFL